MKLLIVLPFLLLFSCVSKQEYKVLKNENNQLATKNTLLVAENSKVLKELEMHKNAQSGKLIKQFDDLKKKNTDLYKYIGRLQSKNRPEHLSYSYLKNEGWVEAYIGDVVRLKENEFSSKDYVVINISNAVMGKALYEEGIAGSFFRISKGVTLAKKGIFSIEVLDSDGKIQKYNKVKDLN